MSHHIDMKCTIVQEGRAFSVVLEVSQCRSHREADLIATWIRASLKGNMPALSAALRGAHLESEVHQ